MSKKERIEHTRGKRLEAIKYQKLSRVNSKEGIVMTDYRTILL